MSSDAPLAYVSRSPSEQTDAPAVVLIHGRGADERDLLPIADQLPPELHVLSVRAPIELDDGHTWYRIDVDQGGIHSSQPRTESFRRSLVRLSKFLSFAVERHDLDPRRIGLLGFSQGATLGLALLTEQPDRLDWVVGLNGYLPDEYRSASRLADARGSEVFLAAGRMDLVVPRDRVERTRDRLDEAGLDVTYCAYPVGHGASDEEIEEVAGWIATRL